MFSGKYVLGWIAMLALAISVQLSGVGPAQVSIYNEFVARQAPVLSAPQFLRVVANGLDQEPVNCVLYGSNDGYITRTELRPPADLGYPGLVEHAEFRTGGSVTAAPLVANDLLYCGSHDGFVYALDPLTLQPVWIYDTGAPVRGSATYLPAVEGDESSGIVYVGSDSGEVYALDASTGEEIWRFIASAPVQTQPVAPLLAEELEVPSIIVGDTAGIVARLNALTGSPIWQTDIEGRVLLDPAIGQPFADLVIVTDGGSQLFGLSIADGQILQTFDAERQILSAPAICTSDSPEGELQAGVFIGTADGMIIKLLVYGFGVEWMATGLPPDYGAVAPTENDPRIYAGEGEGLALDFSTGERSWEQPLGSPDFVRPLVLEGRVVGATFGGTLYIIDGPVALE